MAIDSSGAVLVAALIDPGIVEVSSEDGSYQRHVLPPEAEDASITNLCFGGPDRRTLFLTCAEKGTIISCRWPRPGIRLPFNPV
jgi:gluconolactonase